MFNSIRGIIAAKYNDALYLETSGIEWDIAIPATDNASLPAAGETVRVWTWLFHKEDGMRLYGFASAARRDTFLELLKVDGIGPKGALKIMGGINQEELERALDSEDLTRLSQVPGLGKKTAQKMLLTLKGKITHVANTAAPAPSQYADLIDALAAMGYDKRAAEAALSEADAELGASAADGAKADRERLLFRQAIVRLSGM